MQGPNIMLVDVSKKLLAFKEKLNLWKRKIESQKKQHHFLFLMNFWKICLDDVQIAMKRHLAALIQEFDLIILHKAKKWEWVRNPFAVDALPESCQSITGFEEAFIDIQCDSSLKSVVEKENLGQFWTKIKNEKNIVGMHAVKALLPFVTTCLCESGFSSLTQIKTKTRNCLEPENDTRLALSEIVPNFDKVVESIRVQGSH